MKFVRQKSGAANCNINKSLLQPVNKYIFNATLSGIYIDPGLFRNCTQDHQVVFLDADVFKAVSIPQHLKHITFLREN